MFAELMSRLYEFTDKYELRLEIWSNNEIFKFKIFGKDQTWCYDKAVSREQMGVYPNYISYINHLIDYIRLELASKGLI